ncbi:MAG: hypothetical protein [Bacteriophage sp.]|nr:MAG: hypothetical protein [Bacteriophage sp.]
MSKAALIASIDTTTTLIANLSEKLEKAGVKLVELNTQLADFDKLDAVDVGSVVEFKIGRADTRRVVLGIVKAVKVEEDGSKKLKVEYTPTGDEFDNTFAVIKTSEIVGFGPSEEVEAPAETPEFDAQSSDQE